MSTHAKDLLYWLGQAQDDEASVARFASLIYAWEPTLRDFAVWDTALEDGYRIGFDAGVRSEIVNDRSAVAVATRMRNRRKGRSRR